MFPRPTGPALGGARPEPSRARQQAVRRLLPPLLPWCIVAVLSAQPAPPSPAEAARIIADSASFRAPKRIELLVGGRLPVNVTRGHYFLFEQAGLIRYTVQNAVAEVWLTDRGKDAAKAWTRSYLASYNGADLWHVVIGERELAGTPKVARSDQARTEVEFEWVWKPNETGRMLRLGGGPFRTRAIFELKGGRYRLLEGPEPAALAAQLEAGDPSH